jgi:TonB family protein
MNENKREKRFINLPQYPGGKKAFQEFIRNNLRYPKEALENKIEGTVHVKYRVDGLGKVIDVEVIHGIGSGCDEEAMRVVWLLKYDKVKNRGVRVTASMRTRINFKLPVAAPIEISYVSKPKTPEKSQPKPAKPGGQSYGYTIDF